MFGVVALVSAVAAIAAKVEPLDYKPGGIVHVPYPGALQWLPRPNVAAKECEGCGAPLKAHIHHCEYCRREK